TAGSLDQMPTVTASRPGDPTTGLHVYFGADDNLDSGEHDSSNQVSDGPSDGGGMQVNIDPAAASAWIATLQAADEAGRVSAPPPFANGGFGACADGFCIAVTTQRRVAFQGGRTDIDRDVANYEWSDGTPMRWDPYNCAGPTDSPLYCSDSSGSHNLKYWYNIDGTVYTEPGIQIYEDPDPQASPGILSLVGLDQVKQALTGNGNDPYPLPALYLGTCGLVFGGGAPGDPTRSGDRHGRVRRAPIRAHRRCRCGLLAARRHLASAHRAATVEQRALVHDQARGGDAALHAAGRAELQPLTGGHVAGHPALDDDR